MSASDILRRFMRRAAKHEPAGEQFSGILEQLEKLGHERQGIINVDSTAPTKADSAEIRVPDLAAH